MRTSEAKLNPILRKQLTHSLAQTLLDMKTPEELTIFLNDFFNEAELETFIKRLGVAYWLKKGRSYTNIKNNLRVSSATVASIQNQSSLKGFKLAIKKLEAEEWANVWANKINKVIGK